MERFPLQLGVVLVQLRNDTRLPLDVFINSVMDRFEYRFEHRFEGSNRVTFEYGFIRRIAIKITQSALLSIWSRELWSRKLSTNAVQRYTQQTLSKFTT